MESTILNGRTWSHVVREVARAFVREVARRFVREFVREFVRYVEGGFEWNLVWNL